MWKSYLLNLSYATQTLIFLCVFGFAVLGQRQLHLFVITSGSMEPAIPTGSLVHVVDAAVKDVAVGDIITYQLGDVMVTHRVIKRNDNPLSFITKGDMNSGVDSQNVMSTMVVGKVQWHIPYIGYVFAFAHQTFGFVLLVIIPLVALFILELKTLWQEMRSALCAQK